MARAMYVNVVNEEESRIAIVDDGVLEELSIETSRDELIEGNIYKAKVEKVVPGLDAVFVDFGRERNGFIALSEVRSEYFTGSERKPENLKRSREMMVQVKKGEIGNKGAALTTYVSIPGRYIVLMPHVDKSGISRQIEDEATRKLLRDTIAESSMPEGIGYIVRTAAEDQKKQDIQRDVMYLLRMWKRVQTLYSKASGPGLIYREGDLVIRTIRDYFSPEMKELLVDDPKVHERVEAFFKAVMPWHAKKVKLYEGRAPLLAKHNMEAQIASIHEEKVKLPSGGSIVIQQTEALVSVDVNSGGGSKNKDIEATAFTTNMEAAAEVARQLKLRDLGGLIVVDFIDMRSHANQAAVKKEIQRVLKSDKAQTDVGSISKFGLLELSRQRLRRAAAPRITTPCPLCGGSGKLRSTESFALLVLRVVHSALAKNKYAKVSVSVSADVAAFLFNRKRRQLAELEELFGVKVEVFAEPQLSPNHYHIEFSGDKPRQESNLPKNVSVDSLLARTESEKAAEIEPYGGVSYELLTDEGEPEPEQEVPEEPSETEETEKEEVPAPSEEPRQGGKKRRRRKRKKKSGAPVEHGAQTQPPSPEPPPEPASADTHDEEPPQGQPKKPSRRRGRRRSRKGAASRLEERPAEQAPQEPAPPKEEPAQPQEAQPPKKRSSRRRRGRRRPQGGGQTPSSGQEE